MDANNTASSLGGHPFRLLSDNTKLLFLSGQLSSIIFLTAFIAFFVHRLILIIYRLYFHPLSSFPGPKLAAISSLHEQWYAVFAPGHISLPEYQLSVLHSKYGPVVRVRPDALHISDPDAFRQIHKAGTKFPKAGYFYKYFEVESTLFGSIDLEFHRQRRALVAPLFAKNEVVGRYESVTKDKVDLLIGRISENVRQKGGRSLVLMKTAVSAFVFDVAAEVIFKGNYHVLKTKDMRHYVTDTVDLTAEAAMMVRYFHFIIPIMLAIPEWFMDKVYPVALGQKRLMDAVGREVNIILERQRSGKFDSQKEGQSIIAQLLTHLDSKTVTDEGAVMLGAAVHTTQWSIQRILYHLAANCTVQQRVFEELKSAYPQLGSDTSSMSFAGLESLPYFVAMMKEANRLALALPGSIPRQAPMDQETELCGRLIPPGTILESDIYHVHMNESVFPDPHKFDPERWLKGENSKALEKYLVHFSMGSFMCVGYTLANLVMYLAIASIVRRFEVGLSPELEKEGFLFGVPWTATKRGARIEYTFRERAD